MANREFYTWREADKRVGYIPGEIKANKAMYSRSYEELMNICIHTKLSNENIYLACKQPEFWGFKTPSEIPQRG